jgi:hypothetical protein
MKTKKVLAVLILAGVFSAPCLCMAGALANAMSEWEPQGIYGKVMNMEKDIITVKERKVMLIDDKIARTRYKTAIKDINGNNLDISSLKIGIFIVIKGSGAYDPVSKSSVIVAKEIYILPKEMTEDQMNKYPILTEITAPW